MFQSFQRSALATFHERAAMPIYTVIASLVVFVVGAPAVADEFAKGVTIIDLMDSPQGLSLPNKLYRQSHPGESILQPWPGTSTILVSGDQLELPSGGAVMVQNRGQDEPLTFILVADTLSVPAATRIWQHNDPPGNSQKYEMVIVARRIVFGPNAHLMLQSGKRARTGEFIPGRITIACDEVEFNHTTHSCDQLTKPIRAPRTIVVNDIETYLPAELITAVTGEPGQPTDVRVSTLSNFSKVRYVREFSIWKLLMLGHLELSLREAKANSDKAAILELVRRSRRIPSVPMSGEYRDQLSSRLASMESLRKEVLPDVWTDTVTVSLPAGGQGELRYVGSSTATDVRLFPQQLLSSPQFVAGRRVDGFEIESEVAGTARLRLEFQLAHDPALQRLAKQELKNESLDVSEAVFRAWTGEVRNPNSAYLRTADMQVVGEKAVFNLTIDIAKSGLVLQQLGSSEGLALDVIWRSKKDPSVSGEETVRLSVARRTDSPFVQDADGSWVNTSDKPATVEYLLLGANGELIKPKGADAVAVDAGNALDLSQWRLPTLFAASQVVVPPEAVYLQFESTSFGAFAFERLRSPLRSVRLTNLLSSGIAFGNQQETLDHLELNVTPVYANPEGLELAIGETISGIELFPASGKASTETVAIRDDHPERYRGLRITGRAVYAGGGSDVLRQPRPYDDSEIIYIDRDWLPLH